MDLKTVMEGLTGKLRPVDEAGIPKLVQDARPLIFYEHDFYDPVKLPALETKILNHYLFREICDTPVSRWKFLFNRKLAEILPYYNDLYKSAELDYNPLWDVDYTVEEELGEQTERDTSKTSTHTTEESASVHQEGTDKVTQTDGRDTTRTTDLTGNAADKTVSSNDSTETRSDTGSTTSTSKKDETANGTDTDSIDETVTDTKDGKVIHSSHQTGKDITQYSTDNTTSATGDTSGTSTTKTSDTPTTYVDAFLADKYLSNVSQTKDVRSDTSGTTDKKNEDTTLNKTADTDATDTDKTTVTTTKEAGNTTTHANKVIGNSTVEGSQQSDGTTTTNDDGTVDVTRSNTSKTTEVGKDDFSGVKAGERESDETSSKSGNASGSERGTDSGTRSHKMVRHEHGRKGGSYAQQILEYRRTLLNIDLMLIDELEECFFMVY